ncbi:hypothetical protein [Allorhizobium ampelinum]|uniref:glycine-rich domain-containing protein n=1 Tax=Allorhizobium ampelinum TaxID=3025782 RepID=UPI000B3FC1CC|nr:hypothetical protein [Allorhizobium ampelinum]NTA27386.1 hypothetical protein [Allorhizobium ampelinum]OVE94441.1 hypothetical protein B7W85_12890 [Allorhizobium ampelinum]
MATNQFLPFATATGANVLDQSSYSGLSARTAGFQSGVAQSAQLNKVWRQASAISAMIGQFIVDNAATDANDDGNITALEAAFKAAIIASIDANYITNSELTTALAAYLQKAGGTMTGALTLAANASSALQAVPLQQLQVASRSYVSSTSSVTVPTGATRALIKIWGSGGGGGGSINNGAIAQGGGGAEYREGIITVTAGASMSAVIGVGGNGGSAGGANNGSAGADSSFGGIVAKAGGGGSGSSAGSSSVVANGGTGGSGGGLILAGMNGETGLAVGTTTIISLGGGASFCCGHTSFNAGNYAAVLTGNPGAFPGQGGAGGGSGGGGGKGANGYLIIDWLP